MLALHAVTERIVGPGVLDALILLPFGIAVSRRVEIEGAPECASALRAQAMHCLVVLCGGKDVQIVTDPRQREHTIRAQVIVWAKSPPTECVIEAGHGTTLDVGNFLAHLAPRGYSVTEVRSALNGA